MKEAAQKSRLLKEGHAESEEIIQRLGIWEPMDSQTRSFQKTRIEEIIKTIGLTWPVNRRGRLTKPKILFREFIFPPSRSTNLCSFYPERRIGLLHEIRENEVLPYNRIASMNQIGLGAVEQLIDEGKSALRGEQSWTQWIKRSNSQDVRSDALLAGLGTRLVVDDWGSKIAV